MSFPRSISPEDAGCLVTLACRHTDGAATGLITWAVTFWEHGAVHIGLMHSMTGVPPSIEAIRRHREILPARWTSLQTKPASSL